MTVNKSTVSSTPKTKTKTKTSSSTNAEASTSTSTTMTRTSKVSEKSAASTKQVHSSQGDVSKSSSGSSLQIADVSHLPVNSSLVSYTVTESLPQGGGEKITVYGETGASSTEYRHFIAQEAASSSQSTNITQISSVLNQSTSNLSQTSAQTDETYIVHEPKDDFRIINKNDAAWNGKFILEQPATRNVTKRDGTTVEQSSESYSSEKSASYQKSSSSSYAVEIVDGKEKIIDQKHHQQEFSKTDSNEERLATKSGTNITPELHFSQNATGSTSQYDSNTQQQPTTRSYDAGRDIHVVGDQHSSSSHFTENNDRMIAGSKTPTSSRKADTNWDGTFVRETDAASNKRRQIKSDSSKFYGQDSSVKTDAKSVKTSSSTSSKNATKKINVETYTSGDVKDHTSKLTSGGEIVTGVTYYDSKGNVINIDERVDVSSLKRGKTSKFISDDVTDVTYHDSKGNVVKIDKSVDVSTLRAGKTSRVTSDKTSDVTYYDSKGNVIKIDKTIDVSTLKGDKTSKLTSDNITDVTYYDSKGNVVKIDKSIDVSTLKAGKTSKVTSDNVTDITYYDSKGNIIKIDKSIDISTLKGDNTSKLISDTTDVTYYDSLGNVTKMEENIDVSMSVDKKVMSSTMTETSNVKSTSVESTELNKISSMDETKLTTTRDVKGRSKLPENEIETITTTTYTYYDSKGNVIKFDEDIDVKKTRDVSPARTDAGDSVITTTVTYYDSRGNVIKEESNVNVKYLQENASYVTTDDRNATSDVITTSSRLDDTLRSVEDTSKIRNAQTKTDSRNFYGHQIDSKDTMVKNTYDTTAVQNTISTVDRTVTDTTMEDTTDVIYSNDRNYGKTGWNGKFTYETPVKPKKPFETSTPKDAVPGRKPQKDGTSPKDDVGKTPETFLSETVETTYEDSRTTRDDTSIKYVLVDTAEGPKRVPKPTGPATSTTQVDTTSKFTKDTKNFVDNESVVEYVVVDGVRTPRARPRPETVVDSKTVVENYETVTTQRGVDFVDDRHYETITFDDDTGPRKGPGGPSAAFPRDGPKHDRVDTTTNVEDVRKKSRVDEETVTDLREVKRFVDDRKTVDTVDRKDVFIRENIIDIKDTVSCATL